MKIQGLRKPLKFDKVLVTWGAQKMNLAQGGQNVICIDDKHSHARAHNALIKAKKVLVVGNTFETIDLA